MFGSSATEDQAKTWSILADMWMKLAMAIVVLVGFTVILVLLFIVAIKHPKDWQSVGILAVLEAFFASTLYKPFSHYFPNRDKPAE